MTLLPFQPRNSHHCYQNHHHRHRRLLTFQTSFTSRINDQIYLSEDRKENEFHRMRDMSKEKCDQYDNWFRKINFPGTDTLTLTLIVTTNVIYL